MWKCQNNYVGWHAKPFNHSDVMDNDVMDNDVMDSDVMDNDVMDSDVMVIM